MELTVDQQNILAPKAPYQLPRYEGPQLPQAHGVLVLHKPKGPSSARCLSILKRMGQKKIGHAGTLDPMAEGVLLVLLGHGTKISGHLLTDGNKVYSGTVQLGVQSDTWDAEGQILVQSPFEHIEHSTVHEAVNDWFGKSEQTVPPYSAAKHQGQPLYKLARAGKETPVKKKEIEISQVEVLDVRLPYARFRVECSSGTYIRSLAHSLGMRLGCGAVLTELTREYSHPFGIEQAHTMDAILAEPELLHQRVIPITEALPHWPVATLTEEEEGKLKNGMPLPYREPSLALETELDNDGPEHGEPVHDELDMAEPQNDAPEQGTSEGENTLQGQTVQGENDDPKAEDSAKAQENRTKETLSLKDILAGLSATDDVTSDDDTASENADTALADSELANSDGEEEDSEVLHQDHSNQDAPHQEKQENSLQGHKAILLSSQGLPLALAEVKMVQGVVKNIPPRPMWTILRGLW